MQSKVFIVHLIWINRTATRATMLFALLALPLASAALNAQVPATRALNGTVRASAGDPIANAAVAVTGRDSTTRSMRTDAKGAFSIALLAANAPFNVTVSLLGFVPQTRTVRANADGTFAALVIELQPSAQRLATTQVRAQRPRATRSDREGAGVGEPGSGPVAASGLTGDLTGDIAAAMGTVPGISITPDPNGGLPSISAFGLAGGDNGLTLNGMNFGASGVPRDGVQLRVVQSTYDPSRGGFSGVQTSLRLPRGGNIISYGLHLTGEDPLLQGSTPTSARLGTQYARQIVSGSVNGPIREDKAYYNSSFQLSRRQSDLASLSSLDAGSLQALNISLDSANRLIASASRLGVPLSVGAVPSGRLLTSASTLTRFDWSPNATARAGDILYMLVGATYGENAGVRTGATAFPSHGGDSRTWSAQVQLTSSRFFRAVLNEVNVSLVTTAARSTPYLTLPDARVLVTSALPDGSAGTSTLRLGGNPAAESRARGTSLQLRDDVSWFTLSGRHQFRITFDGRVDENALTPTANRLGSFSFNSLADFDAGRPASYSRSLNVPDVHSTQWLGALGLGSVFRASSQLRVQYGVRLEASAFGNAPRRNPAIDAAFGRRTDNVPSVLTAAPMIGFTRTYSSRGGGSFTGGVRQYVGALSSQLVENASRQTGLPGDQQQITCIGSAVPTPQWRDYSTATSNIPSTCADGTINSTFAQNTPNVSVFSPDYSASKRWGAALGWQGRVLSRWTASVSANYAQNVARPGTIDINFDPSSRFVLATEGNRPVFVLPGAIVPQSGATSATASRRNTQFAQVNDMRSDLRSEARQVIVGISSISSGRPEGLRISTSYRVFYTLSDARDQLRGFGGNTGGNPLQAEWGNSGLPRHTLQVLGSLRIPRWVTVDAFSRFSSGRRFTPLVGGDINGDGLSNDRALIFDPNAATTDATVATRMRTLLTSGPEAIRSCLSGQVGQIAERTSCSAPWSQSLNMALTLDPDRFGLGGRGSVSLVITNVLGAADQLLHGTNNLRNWGTTAIPDATLLNVRGFDPNTNRFRYDVNPAFGTTRASLATGRLPFVVALDVRLKLGPDRDAQELRAFIRPRPADGVASLSAGQIKERMDKDAQNNFDDIAKRAKSVQLTVEQVATLKQYAKQFDRYRDSVYTDLSKYLESLNGNYRSRAARKRWHDAFVDIAHVYVVAGPRIRALLSDEQFTALPADMTVFFDMDEQTFRNFMATANFGSLLELVTGEGVD